MRRLLNSLTESPATLPALLATVLLAVWAATEGGYPVTDWYPGALFLLALLAASALVLPGRVAHVPRPVLVAGGCLLAYAVWSYLSISWADQRGDAWEGANRSLLYFLVFALFALWPQRGGSAAVVLGAWALALAGIALAELIAIASATNPHGYFIVNRVAEPAGYPNATAAQLLMALFPALVLAGRREVPWWLRGAFAAGATVIADVALLSQSRGSIYSLPVVLIVFFAFVPGRLRSLACLLPVAIAVALTAPAVLDVRTRLRHGSSAANAVSGVSTPIVLAMLAVGAVVTAGAWFEATQRVLPDTERRVARAFQVTGIAGGVAVVVAALVLAGNPITRASDAWHSFKRGYSTQQGNTRLGLGLGSNRYDFYRVAAGSFARHPLQGVGADNFGQDYLARGHSDETPRYPHSLELRTLSETGLVGAALLFGAIAAILSGALAAARRGSPLRAAVAGAAAMPFVYWLVHGSFDWFYEYAGLGSAAFAMGGLACALIRREDRGDDTAPLLRGPAIVIAGVLVAAAAAAIALPWLAERDVQRAARTWPADPGLAFARLHQAAQLDPLSDRPALIAGSIALRLGDLGRARQEFADALKRDRRGAYAALELGAILTQQGDRTAGVRTLALAVALAPRDPIARSTLARARAGVRVDITAINQQILNKANEITR